MDIFILILFKIHLVEFIVIWFSTITLYIVASQAISLIRTVITRRYIHV